MCSAKQLIRVEPAIGPALVSHRNAPLSYEGRLRLVQRCQRRPIAHVAAEMGICGACASKWVNRWRRHGELGLHDRSSTPHHSPNATPAWVIERIEAWRREKKWSAQRITHELAGLGFAIHRRSVTRQLARLGLGQRRFLDPNGQSNRTPGKITARWPGHMVHLDVKKVGRIPDGGGWRIHGRDSDQRRAVDRAKDRRSQPRLRLPPLDHRRVLPAGLHRTPAQRAGRHGRRIPRPCQGLVRRPRHHPHSPRRHRQRRLLPLRRLRPDRRQADPAPEDQAVHPTPQWEGRALPAHPRRGAPLRPTVHQRGRACSRDRRLERPLQLPSTPQRRGTGSGC